MNTIHFKRWIRVVVALNLTILSPQLFAQEVFSVKGKVLNTRTEPIKGATVALLNPETFAPVATGICKSNGTFFINDVPEGEYIMTVKKDGNFRAKTKRVSIDSQGNMAVKPNKPEQSEPFKQELSSLN